VDDDDLPDFYSACDMFVFPSLYEGFGLPVLEALACGTVALVSRGSSVPEVAGDGAEYFDPRSVESIVQSFRDLLRNPRRQEELRVKGPAQARRFTWDQTARQVLGLYDTLIDSARKRNR
jgi:glycosyltransferase involved in cell wall biosynthesis